MDELDVEQFLKQLMAELLTSHLIYYFTNHTRDVDRGVRRFFLFVFL